MWCVVAYIEWNGATAHSLKIAVPVGESKGGHSTRRGCSPPPPFRMITSKGDRILLSCPSFLEIEILR